MSRLKGAAIGAGCVVVSLAIAATAALALNSSKFIIHLVYEY